MMPRPFFDKLRGAAAEDRRFCFGRMWWGAWRHMQPDHALYEEMVRRGSRGRRLWQAGVWLYSAGVLGICLILIVWPVAVFFRFGRTGIGYAVAILALGGLAVLGSFLRRVSYRIALGEGIDIAKYFEKPATGKRAP